MSTPKESKIATVLQAGTLRGEERKRERWKCEMETRRLREKRKREGER